jgi:hypothetical protein
MGKDPYPRLQNGFPTVAPGKYTHVAENLNQNTYTFTLPEEEGNHVWIIAHAVVCKATE